MTTEGSEKTWTFKDWYSRNKDKLSESRKARYHSDPEYRAKVLTANQKRRKEKSPTVQGQRQVKIRKPIYQSIILNGQAIEAVLFNIAYFARHVGVSTAKIRAWERNGLIPKTPYLVGSRGERMYTESMINAVKLAIEARDGHVDNGDSLFGDEITMRWSALGVPQ